MCSWKIQKIEKKCLHFPLFFFFLDIFVFLEYRQKYIITKFMSDNMSYIEWFVQIQPKIKKEVRNVELSFLK